MPLVKLYFNRDSKFKLYDTKDYMIHSDTLFSALVNNYALVYDNVSEFAQNLNISSAFLGMQIEDKEIYFLPKPLMDFNLDENNLKKVKKIKFVSFTCLKYLFENINSLTNILDKEIFIWKDDFLVKKDEYELLKKYSNNIKISHLKETKNRLSKIYWGKSEQLFEVDLFQYVFSEPINMFFYFLVKGDIKKSFKTALSLFVEEGIGGDRSIGKGHFKTYEILNKDFKVNMPYFMNLSLIFPKKGQDLKDKIFSYQLLNRSGYIYITEAFYYKKPMLRKIAEGSLFIDEVVGQDYIYDFNKLSLYSYGKAYFIGGRK